MGPTPITRICVQQCTLGVNDKNSLLEEERRLWLWARAGPLAQQKRDCSYWQEPHSTRGRTEAGSGYW